MKKILLKIFGLFFIAMAAPSLYAMQENLKDNPLKKTVESIDNAIDQFRQGGDPKAFIDATAKIFTDDAEDAQRIEALPFVIQILNEKAFNAEEFKSLPPETKKNAFKSLSQFWTILCQYLNTIEENNIQLADSQSYNDALVKINDLIKEITTTIGNKNTTKSLSDCLNNIELIRQSRKEKKEQKLGELNSFITKFASLMKDKNYNEVIKLLSTIQQNFFPNESASIDDFTFLNSIWRKLKDNLSQFDYDNYQKIHTILITIINNVKDETNVKNELKEKLNEEAEERFEQEVQKQQKAREEEEKKEKEEKKLQAFDFNTEIKNAGKVNQLTGSLTNRDISKLVKNLNLLIKYNKSKELIDALDKIQQEFFPERSKNNLRWYYNKNHITRFEDLKDFWENLTNSLNTFNEATLKNFQNTVDIINKNMTFSDSETYTGSDALLSAVIKNLMEKNKNKRKQEQEAKQKQEEQDKEEAKRKQEEQERQEAEKKKKTEEKEQQERQAQEEAQRKQEEQDKKDAQQKKEAEEKEEQERQEAQKKKAEKERLKKEAEAKRQAEEDEQKRQEAEKEPIAPEELQKNLLTLEIQLTALHSSLPKKEKLKHPTKDRSKGPQGRKPPTQKEKTARS